MTVPHFTIVGEYEFRPARPNTTPAARVRVDGIGEVIVFETGLGRRQPQFKKVDGGDVAHLLDQDTKYALLLARYEWDKAGKPVMNPTAKRLAEIEERWDAATAGPWLTLSDQPLQVVTNGLEDSALDDSIGTFIDEADATFAAHAHDDVAWLVAKLREAREARQAAEAKISTALGLLGRQRPDVREALS